MPGFNFTADAATDQLTIAAHGLNTGDGPATTLVGGAGAGGLSESTDYWIIRIDANTIKLATSQAFAMAGTPVVNITANISGYLGVGQPFRRATTYAPNAQVKSADLNTLQDMIKGRKHGLITLQVSPLRWVGSTAAPVGLVYSINETFWPTGFGGSSMVVGLDLPIGTIINAIRCVLRPNAANSMRLKWSKNVGGVGTVLAQADTTVPGADNSLALAGPFEPITAGTAYMLWAARQTGAGESESLKLTEFDLCLP